MEREEKEKIIQHLLEELKSGKSEEEVKKEYDSYFKEDNWSLSSTVKTPKLEENLPTSSLFEEKNPLILLAEENGALRALSKTIKMDLEREDEISKKMLVSSIERFLALTVHYEKMQKLIFPLLEKQGVKDIPYWVKRENDALISLKRIHKDIQGNNPFLYQNEIKNFLEDVEKNIVYENRFFFPVLDDSLNEIELYELYLQERMIGFCLIRV